MSDSQDTFTNADDLTGGFLDIWDGEEAAPARSPEVDDQELMYRPSEAIFGAVAHQMVKNGWSVFPQDEERRPGRVRGQVIAWQTEHRLMERLPRKKDLDLWVRYCPSLNAACAMGQGSGHIFAVDIDVTDERRSLRIQQLADEMLGYTPLRRVGRAPKMALIYRYEEDDPIDTVPLRRFVQEDGEGNPVPSEDGIEILAKAPLTFYGRHHKTGRYFQWVDKSPLDVTPTACPVVSATMINEFLEQVDETIARFHRGAAFAVSPVSWEWDEKQNLHVPSSPGAASAAGGLPWVENAEGKVIDGREAYMRYLVYQFATLNRGLPAEKLGAAVAEHFGQTAELGGKWTPAHVQREALSKARHLVKKIEEGRISLPQRRMQHAGAGKQGERQIARFEPDARSLEEAGLQFLPKGMHRKPLAIDVAEERGPGGLSEEERLRQVGEVQTGLRAVLDDFFQEVRDFHDEAQILEADEEPRTPRIWILKAPTGAGKTSQSIKYIGQHREDIFTGGTYTDDFGIEREGTLPIVFLLPTYQNISELRSRSEVLNLDGSLSDADLRAEAEERGLIAEDELDEKLAELRRDAINAGLTTMVYRGKLAAGCHYPEKVELAMSAGLNSSAFCKSVIKTADGEKETIKCDKYDTCEAITQKAQIQQSHVVFMPHAFMGLSIPKELENVRAVVADERIHHLFLHTAVFPLSAMMVARKRPRLTKREKAAELDPMDLAQDREEAGRVAIDALRRGKCAAHALWIYRSPNNERPGSELVDNALKVCGRAIQRDTQLSPETPIDDIREICKQPTGVNIREEYRFWKIIQERMALLTEDSLAKDAARELQARLRTFQGQHDFDTRQKLERELERLRARPPKAKGNRDYRIQFIRDHGNHSDGTVGRSVREMVRISWRTAPNWLGVPMLLLDASAAPEVIRKIWDDTEVIVRDIQGPLNVRIVAVTNRTFSNASLIGTPSDPPDVRAQTAKRLNQVRLALSTVSSLYGWGRVVAGGSIVLRRAINNGWAGPHNVDWCHYGAMRGLDFAKHHAAAFSVGRMEVPVRAIDGLVAALTYDDDEPEEPYDKSGTGLNDRNEPLVLPMGEQTLNMRDGRIVKLPVPRYPGKWGRLMQKQYREEEQMQFVGRLRPVYRQGDPPVWFALSSVIPDGLIVDDIIHVDDLVSGKSYLWDGARRTGGVLQADVLHHRCPDLFKDPQQAARVMRSLGFDLGDGAVSARAAWGFVSLRWRTPERPWSYAFVMAEHTDHAAVLAGALEESLGITDASIERASQSRGRTLARPRDPDKIDEELGDLRVRKEREAQIVSESAITVFEEGCPRRHDIVPNMPSHPVAVAAGRHEDLRNLWMTYSDREAWTSLDVLWEKLRHEKNKDGKMAFAADEDDTYEQMGDHVDDRDQAGQA